MMTVEEKMLNRMFTVVKMMNATDREICEKLIKDGVNTKNIKIDVNTKSIVHSVPSEIASIILDLKSEIRNKENKKSGKSCAVAAAKRILRNSKQRNPTKEVLHYADDRTGKQVIIDGYQAVELSETDRLNLEPMPEIVATSSRPFEIFNSFPKAKGEKLELPSIAGLKTAIKLKKIESKSVSLMLEEKIPILVDAEFLLNIMEILPTATACSAGKGYPIVFENENNSRGLLMPIQVYTEEWVNETHNRFGKPLSSKEIDKRRVMFENQKKSIITLADCQ